jgi:hypothetical protein
MRWPLWPDAAMWRDPGTWIALGVSALVIVAGVVMHRVFVRVLKGSGPEGAEAQPPADKAVS